jgi:uncharacterized protein (TIGR02996 family)
LTTEDDFQQKLDEHPNDWQTRLVFADWLEEHGDPRAEGYRALGACRYVLCDYYPGKRPQYLPHQRSSIFCEEGGIGKDCDYRLPSDWYKKLLRRGYKSTDTCIPFENRRAAEDAAALAFTKLSAKRRAELLKGRAS